MGGGDLNLKKSWHPSTMKNIEKVWKAEQQQSQEKKKIAELKREIEMEKDREDMKKYAMEQGVIEKKDDKKLDWMYKGPNQLVNREEYLLGRPIDKSFEQMVQTEKDNELNQAPRNHVEHECIPPSLRFFSGNEQVDLARKMQEDPLYAIKKKEMETRNQLLKNPVKLKQLRQLLEQQSKKSKSEKKKKKNKQDIDSDDEAQLDLLLATKYKQLKDKISNKDLIKSMKKVKHKRKKKSRKENETSNSESESSNEGSESDEHIKKHKKKRSKSKEKNTEVIKHSKEKYLTPDKEEEKEHKSYEKLVKTYSSNDDNNDNSIKKRRDRSFNRDIKKYRDKDFRSSSPNRRSSTHKNTYNTENKYKDFSKRSHEKETTYSKSSSNTNRKYYKEDKNRDKWNFKKKQDLTEEEKERRIQEMIANATWRDEERERNVKKYRIEEKKEIDSRKVYNQDFVTKQLAAAAEISTVASRIKANINNIQRSGRAMDTNFAKR
ncbi:pre-mRNA-splicing factor CWC25 homolog isoform X1 [Bombus terrestris]|uniref:Pre-mRNA-splicing factor CWC25 homolog isoform X1 n=2 Tax=Bombus terrestris TaxID=30195 RepID=A0A9B0F4W6_BOMTE|nr:pre-mRNA-splicing factor CWC25 homolog isoform X1 [Bombus terrestris]